MGCAKLTPVSESDQFAALSRIHQLLEAQGIEYWLFRRLGGRFPRGVGHEIAR